MSNEEERYAVRSARDEGITAQVFPKGSNPFFSKLLDMTGNRIEVVYSPWGDAELEVGREAGLQLSVSEAAGSLWIEAVAVEVVRTELYSHAELEVTNGDLRSKLDDQSLSHFNRRLRPRAQLDPESAVEVQLAVNGSGPTASGSLYDISASGLCVRIDRDDSGILAERGVLGARFFLPEADCETQVRMRVRDVRIEGDDLLLGATFEADHGDGPDPSIADFVARSIV